MIKQLDEKDLHVCAKIMMSVYNNEHWQCRWDLETATAYLKDYFDSKKFIGYSLWMNQEIKGAIFCHEKIWWNNNEVFIDEMFVAPELQGQGLGTKLIKHLENYVIEHKLSGLTLSTNRLSPAPNFYKQNGFSPSDHVLFMYKVLESL